MRVKNETFTVQQTTQPSAQQEDDKISFRLTAPFLLNQAFAKRAKNGPRIANILDWRPLRLLADHFPYTVSKAALVAMTTKVFAPAQAFMFLLTCLAFITGAILHLDGSRYFIYTLRNKYRNISQL
jgi:hypothetical protein